jgi:hypothetical protein
MPASKIRLREANKPDDTQFIIDAFDSTIPYLASIGSGEMTPFSQREGFNTETIEQVEQSQNLRPTETEGIIRLIIAEAELMVGNLPPQSGLHIRIENDGSRWLAVGAVMIREDWFPSHIVKQDHLHLPKRGPERSSDRTCGYVYVEVLVTDCRAKEYRRGVGSTLLRGVKDYTISRDKRAIYVDAWAGNGGKLVRCEINYSTLNSCTNQTNRRLDIMSNMDIEG